MPKPEEIPECPRKPNSVLRTKETYDIEIVTPMVGGGAFAGRIDKDFPVRPTAIRGHLRHWWRLVRGHALSPQMMWQREEEIFGSTEFPSPVTVTVEPLTVVEQFDPCDGRNVPRFGPGAYALFASIENKQLVTCAGLRFRLAIEVAGQGDLSSRRKAQNERRLKERRSLLPNHVQPIDTEVHAALAAWLTYGGIGGRTRRGCGAIHCQKFSGSILKPNARIFIGEPQKNAIEAWERILEVYQKFRQTPRGQKHRKTLWNGTSVQVPGRSHWPEADSIRKITGCSLKPQKGTPPSGAPADEDPRDHSTPVVPASILPAFPKAALGMPINFHFADGPNKEEATADRDPKDVRVHPLLPGRDGEMQKVERMASPILTRPLWRDGKWFPALTIIDPSFPTGMQIRIEGREAALGGDLSHSLAWDRVVGPSLRSVKPMRDKDSAIEALIDFILSAFKQEFTELVQ